MQKGRQKYTEFGKRVHMFCAEHDITKKALAEEAGVPYWTLIAVCIGNRPGHDATPRINAALERLQSRRCV